MTDGTAPLAGATASARPETGSDPTDSERMSRVRDGELERLGELYERHHRRLFNFFLRWTGERGAAEDLVQEVFVRILKYRQSFRPGAEFVPWMFALARNAATDLWRARPRELPVDPEAPEPAAPVEDPLDALDREERQRRLSAGLARLTPEKRELILLARSGEMRYDRIGELLGVSVGAVKVRVHRAMKELRTACQSVAEEGRA